MEKRAVGIWNGRVVVFIILPSLLLFIERWKRKPVDMNKRFVSIWFPYLATDWHARKQPQLRDKAFVLKSTIRNRIVVNAANALAKAQGIHENMVLADAKA